ncbi:MAG: hypothetical protein Kow00120_21420 [Anaerolineae bacterium]
MQDRLVARLDSLPRLGRVILCGLVVLITMPLLTSFLDLAPLVVVAVALYVIGWFFWIGFSAQMPKVGAGALLYLLFGLGALLLWLVYNGVLLITLATGD